MRPKPPAPRNPSGRLAPAYAVLAVFFALVQMRMFAILLPNAMLHSAQVTEGLVHGEAAWRVFQSRILTPYLLRGLSAVTGSYLSAYDLFAVVTIAAGAWWSAALSHRLEDPRRPAMAAFLLHQLALSLLIITNWLYPWDLLSIPLFATFHYLVERRAGRRAFAALFGVSILNSEMALFMAGWLVADPILRHLLAPRGSVPRTRPDWGTVGLGALLLAGGTLLIEGLRGALLVKETLPPSTVPSLAVYGRDYHLTLGQNLHELGAALQFRFATGYPILVPAFLVAALALAVQLVRAERDRHAALSLVIVLMIGSFVCFGDLYESRILMPLVPFVAMHGWQALNPARPTSRPERVS